MMNQSALPQAKHTPWNKGKLSGQKRPLKLQEIWAIRIRLQLQERIRELALFNLAIDSKLRACDLMALTVGDIAQAGRVQSRLLIVQKKRADRFSSRLRSRLVNLFKVGSGKHNCDRLITYFRAGSMVVPTLPGRNTPAL